MTLKTATPFCTPWLPERAADAVRDQILSGRVGPGPQTRRFEDAIARHVGSRHCLLTTSGTIALSVASTALGLKPGAEILVPAYGVVSTIHAFASFGLTPRLVDVSRVTGCMSLEDLEARISGQTQAVCFVNFSGYTGQNLADIREICERRRVWLVEDAACAFGQRFRDRSAGTFGHIGTYSFSVPKIITTGQGGAVLTDADELHARAAAFIDHGDTEWRRTNLTRGVGSNLRYTDLQATLGLAQLEDLDARLARKRAVYRLLKDRLGARLFQTPGEDSPLHYIVFTPERETLLRHLRAEGIEAVLQYRALWKHPPYAHLGNGGFRGAEFWDDHAVYLPFGLALSLDEAEQIAHAVLRAGVDLMELNAS